MKNHSKVGNKNGRPTYRTPSVFRYRKQSEAAKSKALMERLRNRGF